MSESSTAQCEYELWYILLTVVLLFPLTPSPWQMASPKNKSELREQKDSALKYLFLLHQKGINKAC